MMMTIKNSLVNFISIWRGSFFICVRLSVYVTVLPNLTWMINELIFSLQQSQWTMNTGYWVQGTHINGRIITIKLYRRNSHFFLSLIETVGSVSSYVYSTFIWEKNIYIYPDSARIKWNKIKSLQWIRILFLHFCHT